MQQKYLSLAAMAERLGFNVKTFTKAVRVKQIPHIIVSNRRRFDPEKVERWLTATPDVVLQFPLPVRKSRARKSKFAEEVGL